jgi:hypothetical protein
MRHVRAVAIALLALVATVLVACSSSSTGTGRLAALMKQGVTSITSAHITLHVKAAGPDINGSGDETLSGGKLTALDLTESSGPAGTLRLRIVNGRTYAGLPPDLNHSGKPWALVTADSSDPVIKSINASMSSALSAASLEATLTFIVAAKSVKLDGPDQVDGAAASHYSVVVDVAKLLSDDPDRQTVISAGLSTLPVELWIDSRGRPVKVSTTFSVQGQSVSTQVGVSKYNVPVQITAPPPDQVSTS